MGRGRHWHNFHHVSSSPKGPMELAPVVAYTNVVLLIDAYYNDGRQ